MTFSNLSELLHALRSRELQNIPGGAKVFLSAGCAGGWYFEWINENYPGIERHFGVEAYSPQPQDLPDEVTWLSDFIYDMKSVSNNAVDLVFAGQTVEHLWPDELAGFLDESYRVLKEEGLLVLDSPNQPVGKKLGWFHPEHTMEFSIDEIKELVTLAGFVDLRVKGIWLCYDRRRKKFLPLEPDLDQIDLDTNKRITKAKDRPEDSFIWWLEAKKSSSLQPHQEKIRSISQNIYDREYNRNLKRVFTQVGEFKSLGENKFIHSMENQLGVLRHGPYIPLKPGNYSTHFYIGTPIDLDDIQLDENSSALELKVSAVSFDRELAVKKLQIKNFQMISDQSSHNKKMDDIVFAEYTLEFSIPEVAFGVEFIVITFGSIEVIMKADVDLIKLDNQKIS